MGVHGVHRCISRSKQVRVHRCIVGVCVQVRVHRCIDGSTQVHRWEYTGEGTQLGE